MKRVTTYLVAVFALMAISMIANREATAWSDKICGEIQKVQEVDLKGDKKLLKISVKTAKGVEILYLCNENCLSDYPAACFVCARCYDECKKKLEAHVGDAACFMVSCDNKGQKFVQGQPCCVNADGTFAATCQAATDDPLCYPCQHDLLGPDPVMVKCFTLQE